MAERAARAGKSLQDYLAGLVTADELVQESAEQVRVQETIRKGVVEHAMDDPAPPFRQQGAGSSRSGYPRYFSPRLSMAQAMRAVLLAMASSTTLVGRRTSRPVSQAERICFLRLDQLRWARAPCTNRRLM